MIAKSHLGQGGLRSFHSLLLGHARQGQRQLHVGEHRLVGDQVVALKHEADRMIAVGVPISVSVFLGGNAVDQKVALGILIKTSDDVEQSGLSTARGAEDGDELALAKGERDPLQSVHHAVGHRIVLFNIHKL